MRQITPPEQHAGFDPFNSSAMRIHRDAFSMIQYFLVRTMSRDQVMTIKSIQNSISCRITTAKPNAVVAKAISDELHMATLLSFVACLMDAGASSKRSRTRIREMTSLSLRLLRSRLHANIPSALESAAMVPDILYLAYTSLYLREIVAARNHVKAIQILVTIAEGFDKLGPHVLHSIMFADICCSLPNLRSPLFDMSKHQLPSVPLTSNLATSLLDEEGHLVQEALSRSTADVQCKKYAYAIVEMAQAVHKSRASYQQRSDVHWVTPKCLLMLSNLLGSFREEAISYPSVNAEALARLEVTKVCLLLWTLLLRKVAWGPERCDFFAAFETRLSLRCKGTELGRNISVALSSWHDIPLSSSSVVKTTAHWAGIITNLEDGATLTLGRFMNRFLQLEGRGQTGSITGSCVEIRSSSRMLQLEYCSIG
jgi:hypothetical protein